jgi:hypothetical protein
MTQPAQVSGHTTIKKPKKNKNKNKNLKRKESMCMLQTACE